MEKNYSEQELSKFMDYAGEKGLIQATTAKARKIAATRILGVLEPTEKKDLRKIDFENTFARFETLNAREMTPGSLVTYKSRAKKAIDDFVAWVDNPSGFRAAPRIAKKKVVVEKKSEVDAETEMSPASQDTPPKDSGAGQHLQVLIRENILVRVSNLPYDLKRSEADRIKKIIDAHVFEGA